MLCWGYVEKVSLIRVYDTINLTHVADMKGHSDTVFEIRFFLRDSIVASASADKSIIVWDFENKSIIKTLTGSSDWVYCIDFSFCGKYLVSGSKD